jgi:hypothetical protein
MKLTYSWYWEKEDVKNLSSQLGKVSCSYLMKALAEAFIPFTS